MRLLYHNKDEELTLLHFTNFNIYFIVTVFSPTQKKKKTCQFLFLDARLDAVNWVPVEASAKPQSQLYGEHGSTAGSSSSLWITLKLFYPAAF